MELVCDTITAGNSSNLMAESDLAAEIEESSGEIEENDGEIEEIGDEIEKSTDEIEQIGDEIGESGDENEESGEEFEEIGDENEESGGKSCDSYVESINEYYKSKWITPQWDVDSFDGLEFDSAQEESECIDEDDDDLDGLDVKQWIRFRRQHIENKGFLVDPELWPMYKYSDHSVIKDLERPAGKGRTYRTFFKEMACLCLERFNKEKKDKNESFINVEFVEVVGGVIRPSGKPKSFITFKAKEKPDGPLVEYQAKVWSSLVKPGVTEHYPILCRPAPPPRKV